MFRDGGDDGRPAKPRWPAIVHDRLMFALFVSLLGALGSALRTRVDLALENLALRQQLANHHDRHEVRFRSHVKAPLRRGRRKPSVLARRAITPTDCRSM